MIGNSLEAEISLFSGDEGLRGLLSRNSGDLDQLFIVSAVRLLESEEGLPVQTHRGEKADVVVVVEKAGGEKCQRCWMYSESVGDSKEYPDVCEKCVDAMSEIGGR
jgi:isoleucyl-tRNA synthetase